MVHRVCRWFVGMDSMKGGRVVFFHSSCFFSNIGWGSGYSESSTSSSDISCVGEAWHTCGSPPAAVVATDGADRAESVRLAGASASPAGLTAVRDTSFSSARNRAGGLSVGMCVAGRGSASGFNADGAAKVAGASGEPAAGSPGNSGE